MFRRHRSESQRQHRRSQQQAILNFLRQPAIQIGILLVAVFVITLIALNGQKSLPVPTAIPFATFTSLPAPTATRVPNVISVVDAYDLYVKNEAYFLDVRERSEWDEFHIPDTTLLPLSQVAALVGKFPRDKTIVIVSAADNRSLQARDILRQAGLMQATSMAGGIIYWRTQGYPIEQ